MLLAAARRSARAAGRSILLGTLGAAMLLAGLALLSHAAWVALAAAQGAALASLALGAVWSGAGLVAFALARPAAPPPATTSPPPPAAYVEAFLAGFALAGATRRPARGER